MLNQFKSTTQGTLGEYITDNYNDTGYTIVTIATKFPDKGDYVPGQNKEWGVGTGNWNVDYRNTSTAFWSLMKKYQPIAVMTTSRNRDKKNWVLEIGAKNLRRSKWSRYLDIPLPFIGAGAGDPASAPGLPNAGLTPEDHDPPDATRKYDPTAGKLSGLPASENALAIQNLIIKKFDDEFAETDLHAANDEEFQGIYPDNYVSAFAGYHALWYDAWSDSCKAGWHTHVDFGITLANATKAIKLQLEVLIKWLDEN